MKSQHVVDSDESLDMTILTLAEDKRSSPIALVKPLTS